MIVEVILAILAIAVYIYWTLSARNRYWLDRGVVHKPPLLFYGNIKERLTSKTAFHEFYNKFYFEFEGHPYVGIYEGRIPVLLVRDPELIKKILFSDFEHFVDRTPSRFKSTDNTKYMLNALSGTHWRDVRAVITPTFTSGKMKAMFSTVEACALKMVDYLKKRINESPDQTLEGVDTKELYGKVALEVIASSAFGVQVDSFEETGNKEFIEKIANFNQLSKLTRYILLSLLILDLPNWLTKRITLSFFNNDSVDYLAKVYKDTAKYRTENGVRRNDFLQILLDGKKKKQWKEMSDEGDDDSREGVSEDLITEEVAIGQAVIFFIAGYETSSTLLSLASYSLSMEKDVQQKLRDEILNKLGDNQEATYDKVKEMHYLDMVLSETLRLYPPLARIDRVCTKPYKLGSLEIPVGGRVAVPCIGIHRDPKYYPEPEKFRPERFSPEESSKRHPCVYMPFGLGPRNCVGMRFAQMSTKIIMAHMLKNFIIDVDAETPIPFVHDERSMLLKPKGGKLKIKLRAN